jgi:hypothetical protein
MHICPAPVQLWLGGSPNQTRLAKVFMERMKVRDLEATLEPLFAAYKARRTTKVGNPAAGPTVEPHWPGACVFVLVSAFQERGLVALICSGSCLNAVKFC